MYYKWTVLGLIIIISWVDDLLLCGKKEAVLKEKEELLKHFDCDDIGELNEYVGCKIERTEDSFKLTQPVLLQSYQDEFKIPNSETPRTPAAPKEVLQKTEEMYLTPEEQKTYRTGVGKLLHMMKWSRPEISNAVRDLSRFVRQAGMTHMKCMLRVMHHCAGTPIQGKFLKPNKKHDGTSNFEFEITGRADSNYATDSITRRSVSGYATFLNGSVITTKSKMQGCVTLSVTEAEYVAATECAQDMLFNMRILESLGLKVKKPMILEIDNKGAIDLTNNWSAGGRTRHIDVRHHFLRELKEQEVIKLQYIATEDNDADLFTKNVDGTKFDKFTQVYCGIDEYNQALN